MDKQKEHSITLVGRTSVTLKGVEEVMSYDENNIVMQTNLGQLTLDGSGLNIVKLNLGDGEVCAEGRVDAIYYMEQNGKRSLFSKIFG